MPPSTPSTRIIPQIQSWLTSNHAKILNFWVGADWRMWARFELFTALEASLPDSLVTHSNSDFWVDSDDEVDVLVEPRGEGERAVAIVLVCERVNENEGSYEAFVARWEAMWARINAYQGVQGDFEGVQVLLVGFGGEMMGEGIDEFTTSPRPEVFTCGEVRCFYKGFEPRSG